MIMATALRLRYFIVIIGVSSFPRFSDGLFHELNESPYEGVKVVTRGEPCPEPRYLPVRIEKPAQAAIAEKTASEKLYQPLRLKYETINPLPRPQYLCQEYPISIEVPEVQPREIATYISLPRKSYDYDIQIPPTEQIPTCYNFDFQVLPSNPTEAKMDWSYNRDFAPLLNGLTSRIDRIVIPACENPSCSCRFCRALSYV
ncbi:PREDICTED: uncharacterized protein LOC106741896 [Dinoponera quadriceps]|uniref:Uncharacterized protein LOC106741896 n=1 Tax=Dinoponera quadriceps TaxID=609295 RepID=A0A6P3WUM0_DINQU|nr:PREDICTED: uncharacterized protein LOC106741896 [Dinoponera quadriceps]